MTITDEGRTLWDWLQLLGILAIPIVVAVGTAVFTTRQIKISEDSRKQQHDTEMQIAEEQQQEELLRTYFDKISDLLLDKELSTNPNIQAIVLARTLAVLRRLNTERKTVVLRFLHNTDLLQYVKGFLYSLDLSKTDLPRVDLSHADLSGANLSGTILNEATLVGANLIGANLNEAGLTDANLSEALLSDVTLSKAYLDLANLSGADLDGANLSNAHLSGVTLIGAYLFGAKLSGAYLGSADLSKATLSRASLSGADLSKANLSDADLSGTKLFYTTLSDADLSRADLSDAELRRANLSKANLSDADLRNANLWKAWLEGATATAEQFTKAKHVTPEQLAQLKSLKRAAPQETKTEQASITPVQLKTKPDPTSQAAVEQKEHTLPKQDTDAVPDRSDGSMHP